MIILERYGEAVGIEDKLVSDRQIYINKELKGMYYDTCICELLWPRIVLIRDLIITLPATNPLGSLSPTQYNEVNATS